MDKAKTIRKIDRRAVCVVIALICSIFLSYSNVVSVRGSYKPQAIERVKIIPAGMNGDSDGWQNGVALFMQDLGAGAAAENYDSSNSTFFEDSAGEDDDLLFSNDGIDEGVKPEGGGEGIIGESTQSEQPAVKAGEVGIESELPTKEEQAKDGQTKESEPEKVPQILYVLMGQEDPEWAYDESEFVLIDGVTEDENASTTEAAEKIPPAEPEVFFDSSAFGGAEFNGKPVADYPDGYEPKKISLTKEPYQKGFELSRFSVDESIEAESIEGLQLRFSMGAAKPLRDSLEPNMLRVEYIIDGSDWQVADRINLNREISNRENGGFFLAALPTISDFSQLEGMKLRFTYEANSPGSGQILYIDAVWLEMSYIAPLPPNLEIDERRQDIVESLFSEDENPMLIFANIEEKKNFLQKIWAWIKGEKRYVSAKLVDPAGDEYNTNIQIKEESVIIEKNTNRQFRPGRYKLIITITNGDEVQTEEQSFEWGVLTVNSDKSMYKAGDQARLFFGVLDELGHTICDADIILAVTDPEGNTSYPAVDPSGECGPNNITNLPDYSATYNTKISGTYKIDVVATSENGTHEITDSFEAMENVIFDVTRMGPTRINPTAAYEMRLNVVASQDYSGQVVEYVPADFEVSALESFAAATTTIEDVEFLPMLAANAVETKGNIKTLVWDVDLHAGYQYVFSYQFNAPDISPYIFLIGPLQIGDFFELRKWQVASDAISGGVATASGTGTGFGISGNGNLTSTLPTSWAEGQLAILLLYCDQGSGSTPQNWTEVSGSPWGATVHLQAFYKFLAAGESNPVTTISGSTTGESCVAAIATFNDVDTSTPIEAVGTAAGGTGTPMTAGSINTSTAGALALGLCGRGDNEAASSQTFGGSATGVSEIFDSGNGTGNDAQVSMYAKTIASPGASGLGSAATSALDPWISVQIALKPAPPLVSGGCFTDLGEATACMDDANNAVKVAVNGVVQSGSDTVVDGSWSFRLDSIPDSGSTMVFYVDGEDTESEEATTVVKYDGSGDVDLVKLYQSHLTIGSDSGSANSDQTISIADIDTDINGYENSDDEDVLYDVTSGNDLVVDAGNNKTETLFVISGDTYRPASGGGGDTTTHNLNIEGTVTADNNTISIAGEITKTGTFNINTSTVTFNASAGPWPYRKSITVDGYTGAGTDYQVLLNVGESSGSSGADFNLGGNATNFPNDIMFTDNDGFTSLSYWVQEISGSSPNQTAKIWVKVADNLNTDQDIYIYYGRAGYAGTSNADNTFMFFDDFNDSSIDTNKWVSGVYYCTNTEASGYLRQVCQLSGSYKMYAYVGSVNAYNLPYTVTTSMRCAASNVWASVQIGSANTCTYDSANMIVSQRMSTLNSLSAATFWVNSTQTSTAQMNTNTWTLISLKAKDGDSYSVYDGNSYNLTTSVGQTSAYIRLDTRKWSNYVTQCDWDWVAARKYSATEPAYNTSGIEESGGAITQIIPIYNYHNLNISPAVNDANVIFESGTYTINGDFIMGNGTNTGVDILATAGDPNISVGGAMTVNANTTFYGSDSNSTTLNIDGALTINGTFAAPPTTGMTNFTLGGNFVNNGNYTHNSGRITLDGNGGANNQTLNGSTTPTIFYQFYATAGGTRTIYFKDGNHYAIAANGTFSLAGTSSFGLTVTRESTSGAWYLDVSSTNPTISVTYTTASWSNASGGYEIDATGGTNTNGLNNTNWVFVITNTVPTFSVNPHEDPVSDNTTPTNAGSNLAIKATATDSESNQWYLAICKTNSISPNSDSPPTCNGGVWAISTATAAGSEATASAAISASESNESYDWYGFACDKTASQYKCTSMSNGGTSGNNGSPFAVNHTPTFTAISNNGPKDPGSTVTVTANTWDDDDAAGNQDTGGLYVCKTQNFAAGASPQCDTDQTWCSVTGITPPIGSWYSDYAYRVKIPVTATAAGAQTDYTMSLSVVKGSGTNAAGTVYLNNHSLNWPYDIRFTASDGTTKLNAYREEYDATDGTWNVKINYIGSAGDTDVYLYYGKSGDTDDAGPSTIDFAGIWGDGFETGDFTYRGNWWPYQSNWSVQSSVKQESTYAAQGNPGNLNTLLQKQVSYTNSYAVKLWVRVTNTGNYFTYPMCGVGQTTDFYPVLTYGGHFMYWNGTTTANLPTDKTYDANTWYKVEYAIDFESSPHKIRWLYVKDGDAGTADLKDHDNGNVTSVTSLYNMGSDSGGPTFYIDQIQVRKYAYPEPTWAAPSTETAGTATLSCDLSVPNPQAHGTVNYYAYLVDSHGLAASGGQQGAAQTFAVNDVVPTVSSTPTLNNTAPINLVNEKSTTDIYVKGIVTDDNGCADATVSTTADAWQTNLTTRTGCDNAGEANGNKCYYHVSCVYDSTVDPCAGGSDKTGGYKCTVPFEYYANPTDANTPWSGDNWTATFIPGDEQGANVVGEINTAPQEMNSFLSVGFASGYNSVSFGSMDPGTQTNPLLESMRIEATGNCAANVNLYGTPMTGPGADIPAGNQRYGLGASAPAWSSGTALTGSEVLTNLGVCKSGYTAVPEWKPIWWGIDVPGGQASGDYTGTDYVVAVKKAWASSGDWCE